MYAKYIQNRYILHFLHSFLPTILVLQAQGWSPIRYDDSPSLQTDGKSRNVKTSMADTQHRQIKTGKKEPLDCDHLPLTEPCTLRSQSKQRGNLITHTYLISTTCLIRNNNDKRKNLTSSMLAVETHSSVIHCLCKTQ